MYLYVFTYTNIISIIHLSQKYLMGILEYYVFPLARVYY